MKKNKSQIFAFDFLKIFGIINIMKSYRKELNFNLPSRRGYINITGDVQKAIDESGIKEGLVLVNAMNITASVFINDDEYSFSLGRLL